MKVLVLGGTAFLGHALARQAVGDGHRVTCAARGHSGPFPAGATIVRVDRDEPGAFTALAETTWDLVIDVSWQPGRVRSALAALARNAGMWIYVSSVSVYADFSVVCDDEGGAVLEALDGDLAEISDYGAAKVACENACREAMGDRLLVARAGLIGGPGDVSGRSGAWVARSARDPILPMLVPEDRGESSQVVDVRDLACWLVHAGTTAIGGTFDAVGPAIPFREWVDLSRAVGGHSGEVVEAPAEWLLAQGVTEFAGPESMAMWMHETSSMVGWSRRAGAAAHEAGLVHRTREALLEDVLAWEVAQGVSRKRGAGLAASREVELISQLRTEWGT